MTRRRTPKEIERRAQAKRDWVLHRTGWGLQVSEPRVVPAGLGPTSMPIKADDPDKRAAIEKFLRRSG